MTAPTEWFVGDDVPVNANVADADLDPESANTITVVVTDPTGTPCTVSSPTQLETGVYQAIVESVPLGGVYAALWTVVVDGNQKSWRYTFTVQGGKPAFPPFASPDDLAARWRPLTSQESITARALLNDASALIRARFPGIDGQMVGGLIDAGILVAVTAGMVKRAMVAPSDGVSQQAETAGPFSRSQTFANPLGNVFLTLADMTMILGYQPPGQSNYFANDTSQCGNFADGVNLSYDVLTVISP